jgi:hypothetical protein
MRLVVISLILSPLLRVVMMADSTTNRRSRDSVMVSYVPDDAAGHGAREASGLRAGGEAKDKSGGDHDLLEHCLRPQ